MSEQLSLYQDFKVELVKFIYFDLGNVVFRFEGGLQKLAELYDLDLERCKQIWADIDELICSRLLTPENLIWEMLDDKWADHKVENFAQFWVDHFQPMLEMHQFMYEIAAVLPIGVLSNIYSREIYQLALEAGKIPVVQFCVEVLSSEQGYAKPHPKIFQIAQSKAFKAKGVVPEEILFIDDNRANVEQALSMGWQAVLFNATTIHWLNREFFKKSRWDVSTIADVYV
jgi:FMN phosphatase YigB (HAD superfamily)